MIDEFDILALYFKQAGGFVKAKLPGVVPYDESMTECFYQSSSMKNLFEVSILTAVMILLTNCSPVLDRRLAEQAFVNVPLATMTEYPLLYKADLYLLGGLVTDIKETEKGLLLEALYFRVNTRGYIEEQDPTGQKYLALVPVGMLADKDQYGPGKYISMAARFVGVERGISDSKSHPLFEVRDVHSWGTRYRTAFSPPAGVPTGDQPVEPMPVWENPVSPDPLED